MNTLERRIIDISYKKGLSHIGSCLTALPLIEEIFGIKRPDEPFVLSNGHAGLALYVVLEKYGYGDAEELFDRHGTHPNTDLEHGIWCSTGSLGHGVGIAVGMALEDGTRNVYVLMSDGECAEGSVWEALRIAAEYKLRNLRVTVNANGFGATDEIDREWLNERLQKFFPVTFRRTHLDIDCLKGLQGHYHVLTKGEYEALIEK